MPPAALVDPATIDTSKILYDLEAIRRGNPQRFEMEQLTAIPSGGLASTNVASQVPSCARATSRREEKQNR